MSDWFGIFIALAMAFLLLSYLWRTLKTGEAVGLFFGFGRAREPVRYWLFAFLLIVVTASQLWLFAHRMNGIG